MRVTERKPPRYPWWQLVLLGIVAAAEAAVWPIRRMWRSAEPLDRYGLAHMTSAAGDTLLAIALADSVFFSIPADQAAEKVAAYLGLTMLPLALAGPLLVPLLDRAGPRRAISFAAAIGRAAIAVYAAPRLGTQVLFPAALGLLVLSKVHTITKNGLTMAYGPAGDGLMRANARLGRIAVGGAVWAFPLGFASLRLWGSAGPMYLASVVYLSSALSNLRLPRPRVSAERREVGPRGRLPALTQAALGAVGMRAASGFLLFLMAFALRRGGQPTWWFGVLAASAVAGGFLADLLAPRLNVNLAEEAVVIGCVIAAGFGALVAFEFFAVPVLALFALATGATTEFGRLAFQSLMQRHAPEGALGRVFVRYEVVFQLSWVGGAFLPAVLPIQFRGGILALAGFYVLLGAAYFARQRGDRGATEAGGA
ncbi:MAG: hypothetical protein HY240_00840 [Actinobacteria bacterium]|nr:hypothetical protein [Actinomycetota bacterium]